VKNTRHRSPSVDHRLEYELVADKVIALQRPINSAEMSGAIVVIPAQAVIQLNTCLLDARLREHDADQTIPMKPLVPFICLSVSGRLRLRRSAIRLSPAKLSWACS
jgi:hypothetical protein